MTRGVEISKVGGNTSFPWMVVYIAFIPGLFKVTCFWIVEDHKFFVPEPGCLVEEEVCYQDHVQFSLYNHYTWRHYQKGGQPRRAFQQAVSVAEKEKLNYYAA